MTSYWTSQQVDAEYDHIFGIGSRSEYEAGLSDAPFPTTYIKLARRIVERSCLVGTLQEWERVDRTGKHPGGRPRAISHEAALIVLVMHMLEHRGMSYLRMGRTLSERISPKQAELIGLVHDSGAPWYDRIWSAVQSVLRLIDPYPYPSYERTRDGGTPVGERITRRKIPTAEQVRTLQKWRDPELQAIRQKRIDAFMNALVTSSVKLAGKHLAGWQGNSALDATFLAVLGKAGRSDDGVPYSVDYDAGWYIRSGDHNGEAGKGKGKGKTLEKRYYGYELELAAMIRNHPDDDPDRTEFPLLFAAVGYHAPSRITEAPRMIYQHLSDEGHPAGFVAVDRAYNNLQPDNFAGPLTALGHRFMFDYKINQLGTSTSYEQFILVEGQWYVHCMRRTLIDAEWDFRKGRITEKERNDRIDARERFRLKPKGRPDADGFQRYFVPDLDDEDYLDVTTGEVRSRPTSKTVSIPGTVGLKDRQYFPYRSKQWVKYYGLRSTVEGGNAFLKSGHFEDIANPYKRPGRGYAYQYLMTTLGVVSGNIRKLKSFLDRHEAPRDPKSPNRSRRRRSDLLQPMAAKPLDGRRIRHPTRT